ncbi:hypothetical protein EYF80_022247 [Liparis tanakae]|uniref:Uncharacterized protein n=1 Tax=Liparis tanakae TaxID=230148 RepID=A0A4Z2HRE8_9TELE|nr:hypothetical protein EYF80_022247 [Liparis tanakae]
MSLSSGKVPKSASFKWPALSSSMLSGFTSLRRQKHSDIKTHTYVYNAPKHKPRARDKNSPIQKALMLLQGSAGQLHEV